MSRLYKPRLTILFIDTSLEFLVHILIISKKAYYLLNLSVRGAMVQNVSKWHCSCLCLDLYRRSNKGLTKNDTEQELLSEKFSRYNNSQYNEPVLVNPSTTTRTQGKGGEDANSLIVKKEKTRNKKHNSSKYKFYGPATQKPPTIPSHNHGDRFTSIVQIQ